MFPRLPRPQIDSNLPNLDDFDSLAEKALAPLYRQEPSTSVSLDEKKRGSKVKLEMELKDFKGPSDTLVDLDSRREFKTEAEEQRVEERKRQPKKKSNLMPRDIHDSSMEFQSESEKPAKPNMDDLYDSRHEFDPEAESADKIDTTWFEDKVYNAPDDLLSAPIAKQPRWMQAQTNLQTKVATDEESATGPIMLEEILGQLEEFAAFNVNVIDARTKVDHVDYVIVCEGRSQRHVYSIADSIRRLVLLELTKGKT